MAHTDHPHSAPAHPHASDHAAPGQTRSTDHAALAPDHSPGHGTGTSHDDHGPSHHGHGPGQGGHAPGQGGHGRDHEGHEGHGARHDHGPGHEGHAPGHGGNGPGHGHGPDDGLQEMLDLDAEIAAGPLADLINRIAGLATGPVRDILDIGAGTGTGSFALLRHFPEATVTAVDTAEEMLSHLGESARRHGLADRIRPLRADLDTGWPETGTVDLIWASSSMHHMADPDRVLRDMRASLRPGGLLTVIEMESMPRFLPDDLGFGRPGLEARCHTVMERIRNEGLPHMGSDWAARLTAAGFTIRESGDLIVELPSPLPDNAVRYAYATLRRFRAGLADRISAEDQATLDTLLTDEGPHSLRAQPGLAVRSTRSVWTATPS